MNKLYETNLFTNDSFGFYFEFLWSYIPLRCYGDSFNRRFFGQLVRVLSCVTLHINLTVCPRLILII